MDLDILLIDEVLAVGDEKFQKKCFVKMNQIKNSNKAIVFVSHNLDWIIRLCSRVIFLQNGKIQFDGPPRQAINHYLKTT